MFTHILALAPKTCEHDFSEVNRHGGILFALPVTVCGLGLINVSITRTSVVLGLLGINIVYPLQASIEYKRPWPFDYFLSIEIWPKCSKLYFFWLESKEKPSHIGKNIELKWVFGSVSLCHWGVWKQSSIILLCSMVR